MSEIAIRVDNLSKQYRLGEIGTGSLSHDLNRWWHRIRGKEDPYLRIGEVNDRTTKGTSDYVWALKDVNFEIKKGEAVGIVGKNGAGKSTLLKLLSRVTAPTQGIIKYNGKMAALLEVGTGFHGELTGRENIYLNGSILGMRRKEITNKMDEIIDFAGVEKYIDTPVKRYSSGMYVRLAFAVAAHLDTDILILDEVLAVGDASFQRKCLGKMNDAATNHGKTVLFVSHNLSQVRSLCKSGILLENGQLQMAADINTVLNQYTYAGDRANIVDIASMKIKQRGDDLFTMNELEVRNKSRNSTQFFEGDDIELIFRFHVKEDMESFFTSFSLSTYENGVFLECRSTGIYKDLKVFKNTSYTLHASIPLDVKSGTYHINLGATSVKGLLCYFPNITVIDVLPKETEYEGWNHPSPGLIQIESQWNIE
jgi:lipopolysaccharide transport system ATP-binding protein